MDNTYKLTYEISDPHKRDWTEYDSLYKPADYLLEIKFSIEHKYSKKKDAKIRTYEYKTIIRQKQKDDILLFDIDKYWEFYNDDYAFVFRYYPKESKFLIETDIYLELNPPGDIMQMILDIKETLEKQ